LHKVKILIDKLGTGTHVVPVHVANKEIDMGLTEAEKKQLQRERKRAEHKANSDSCYPYLKETFSEFLEHEGNYVDVEIALGLAGIEAPLIEDERDPEEFALEEVKAGIENLFPGAQGAIGRAEVLVDCLLDAATQMALVVNNYKRQEIQRRLKELEKSTEMDTGTKMNEAVKLNKLLEALDKDVRRSLPQWKITGV